ncbi:HEPN domain-containing protein [Fimbriiglobus ruber]|uniref:HEPN domain-containing protein n=1 Tax=Fimbriiglobus ruber TaxID=1908690 RepID=UPI003B8463E3
MLRDAEELNDAYTQLQGVPAMQHFATAALSRAVVVMCISAWETYIEELVRESLQAIHTPLPHPGLVQALNELLRADLDRFNTPSAGNVPSLLRQTIGLADIRRSWYWPGMTIGQAGSDFGQALNLRHRIAHGVHPRPFVHNHYTSQLPDFFRRLGRRTDAAVRNRLVNHHAIAAPWSP